MTLLACLHFVLKITQIYTKKTVFTKLMMIGSLVARLFLFFFILVYLLGLIIHCIPTIILPVRSIKKSQTISAEQC